MLAWYHAHGLDVTPINPTSPEINLPDKSYKTVASPALLDSPEQTSLSIVTPPAITKRILETAKSVGISSIWLQPGSFDAEALDYAKSNFAAIGGSGGDGHEGWCVLVDGENALEAAQSDQPKEKL